MTRHFSRGCGEGLLEPGRPASGPVVGAGGQNVGFDRSGYHLGPEEPPEHAHDRFQFAAALQGDNRLGAAEFHLVVFQGLTADAGDDPGGVDDDGVGGLAGLFDQGGGGNDLLKDQSLGADPADEVKSIGMIELLQVLIGREPP